MTEKTSFHGTNNFFSKRDLREPQRARHIPGPTQGPSRLPDREHDTAVYPYPALFGPCLDTVQSRHENCLDPARRRNTPYESTDTAAPFLDGFQPALPCSRVPGKYATFAAKSNKVLLVQQSPFYGQSLTHFQPIKALRKFFRPHCSFWSASRKYATCAAKCRKVLFTVQSPERRYMFLELE